MKGDRIWQKTTKERKEFLDKLRIAIDTAGGRIDNLGETPLEEIFTDLLPNGIRINFDLIGDCPWSAEYHARLLAFNKSGTEDVEEFLQATR